MSVIDPLYDATDEASSRVLEGLGQLDEGLGAVPTVIGQIPTGVAAVIETVPGTVVPTVAGLVAYAGGAPEALGFVDDVVVGLPGSVGTGLGEALTGLDTLREGLLAGVGAGLDMALGEDGPVLATADAVLDQVGDISLGLPLQFENISTIAITGAETAFGGAADIAVAGLGAVVGSEASVLTGLTETLDPSLDILGPYGGSVVDAVQQLGTDAPAALQGVAEGSLGSAQTFLATTGTGVGGFVTDTQGTLEHFGTTFGEALAAAPSDPLTAVGMIGTEVQGTTVPGITESLQTNVEGIGTGAQTAAGDLGMNTSDFADHLGASLGDAVTDLGVGDPVGGLGLGDVLGGLGSPDPGGLGGLGDVLGGLEAPDPGDLGGVGDALGGLGSGDPGDLLGGLGLG